MREKAKDYSTARGASFTLNGGNFTGTSLRVSGSPVTKVSQRTQTMLMLKDGSDKLALESLPKQTSGWEVLNSSGGVYRIAGLSGADLEYKMPSQASLRNAVQQAARKARLARKDTQDGLDALHLTGGAFPLDFGDSNYVSTSPDKTKFPRKYLFSGQVEAGADFGGGVTVRAAAAYHYFQNLQGELSDPCLIYAGATECSTDGRRPFFLRQGNTLSPLRQIAVDPNLPAGQIQPQPQFFGLTFNYQLLDLNAVATVPISEHAEAVLGGDYVRNLGFKRGDICRNGLLGQPFNNGGSDGDGNICSATNPTSFVGGDTAYTIYGQVGFPAPRRWGEWRVQAGYRYIESDATLDSFTDDNFHNGGTNAKGYYLGGTLGLYDGLTIGGRWLSANEISGEPYAVDILQIDLNAAF